MLNDQPLTVELGQDFLDRRVLVQFHVARTPARPLFFLRLATALGRRCLLDGGFLIRLAKRLFVLFAEQAKIRVGRAKLC